MNGTGWEASARTQWAKRGLGGSGRSGEYNRAFLLYAGASQGTDEPDGWPCGEA